MESGEQASGADPPETLAGEVTAEADPGSGDQPAGNSGQLDATVTLRSTSSLRLALPADPDALSGELHSDGQIRLALALPGGVERLSGEHSFHGPLTLSVPLPGAAGTIEVPATLDGTAGLRMDVPGCVRLDAQGAVDAPLVVRIPLPRGQGALDLDARLGGDASLGMSLPGGHGQLQAHVRAEGPWALRMDLPQADGRLTAHGNLGTPLTLSVVLPSGRAKLGVHDTLALDARLQLRLPSGGSIEAAAPLELRLDGMLFLPSGRGEVQASAPIRARIQVRRLVLPHLHTPLSLDLRVDGAAELTTELPGHSTRLRAHFTAGLPLPQLVQLVRSEIERQVLVDHIELGQPRQRGPHDVTLPLLIVARRGAVQARLEATAQLRIDPRSKQIELRSVHAEGQNAAGRAASWLYINPRLLRSLRRTLLFDPSGALPPEAHIEALGFKAVGHDELSVEGVLVWQGPL